MKPKAIFDELLTEYAKTYGVYEDIEERLDAVIETILAKISGGIQPKVNAFNKKNKDKDIEILPDLSAEKWESHLTLRRKSGKKPIMRLAYGFDNGIASHDSRIDKDSIYFSIWVAPLKEGNGFKTWPEVRTFWKQEMVPRQREEDYIIPFIPADDDAYAYYGIYTLLGSEIMHVFSKRGKQQYLTVVEDAFEDEFKTNLKYYCGLKEEVKEWREREEE